MKRSNHRAALALAVGLLGGTSLLGSAQARADDDGIDIEIVIGAPTYEERRHLHRERKAFRERYKDGKSDYKYDDGVVKIEEKIDRRAGKYEYKYEGPDGKCEEKYDRGKYEYKCD